VQLDLAADQQRRLAHEIQRSSHRTLCRVLHRDHCIVGLAAFDGTEHVVDRRAGFAAHEVAEVLDHCRMRERARGAEIGNPQRLLERHARRHHLPEYAGDRFVGQRAAVLALQAAQDLRLALRPVHHPAGLERADRLRVRGPRVEALEDLAIEGIDRGAMGREIGVAGLLRHVRARWLQMDFNRAGLRSRASRR
jgi:hypothetical protein